MARAREQVGSLLVDRRRNAGMAWLLTAVIAAVAVESALVGNYLWMGFAGAMLALVVLPPLSFRDATVMLPWEVVGMAALPVLGRALATVELTGNLATYLSVAALALVVAVELHAFTPVRMTVGFAVVFVVVTTMATAGVWAVARWAADLWLGTHFLLGPGTDEAAAEQAVTLEFVYSTVAGLVAGGVFEFYFRRRAPIEQRVSREVEP